MNIRNKKGATSVLIILLMVVLMVFGLTILTTTLSNKNLSEKKQVWLNDYYQLESDVALSLAEIDFKMAEMKASVSTNDALEILYNEQYTLYEFDGDYYYDFEVSDESGEYSKYIYVSLLLNMDLDSKKNYDIVEYSETQDLFEYEDIQFGNPFFPNND